MTAAPFAYGILRGSWRELRLIVEVAVTCQYRLELLLLFEPFTEFKSGLVCALLYIAIAPLLACRSLFVSVLIGDVTRHTRKACSFGFVAALYALAHIGSVEWVVAYHNDR